jgi:PGF-pre-PGF domain-containing protein
MPMRKLVFIAVLCLVLSTAVTAVMLEEGFQFGFEGETYLVMGDSFSVANVSVYDDAVTFGSRNISVTTNNTSVQVNTSLIDYNMSAAKGENLFKVRVEAERSVNTTLSFTGIPEPAVHLTLERDGAFVRNISTGGTVRWSTTGTAVNYSLINRSAGTSSTSTDGDDGGSSGGSGGTTSSSGGTPISRVSEYSHAFDRIERTATVSVPDREKYGVHSIDVQVGTPVENVRVTVAKQEGRPASVSTAVPGLQYRYLQIDATGTEGGFTATVRFPVNRSWLEEQDVGEDAVSLSRYYNETWEKLPTSKIGENGSSVMYSATTGGFSYFAVAADPVDEDEPSTNETNTTTDDEDGAGTNETETTVSGDETNDTTNTTDERQDGEGEGAEKETADHDWLLAVIVGLVLLLLAGYAVRERKWEIEDTVASLRERL